MLFQKYLNISKNTKRDIAIYTKRIKGLIRTALIYHKKAKNAA